MRSKLPRSRQRAHAEAHTPEPRGESEPIAPAAGLLERLIFLSDGVFAIAMTLLVVELAVPQLNPSGTELGQQLHALYPKYVSYAISFMVIASYWTSHQRIFGYIVRADSRLVWLNILLLLFIAFQPFPTSVLGTYGTTAAVTFYAGTLVVTGVIVLALWVYATRDRRLVSPTLDARLIQHHTLRAACVPVVFLISIGVAQVNPSAAEFSWLTVAVLIWVLRWRYRDNT
jgi:TMEM175 potassium channel family protein